MEHQMEHPDQRDTLEAFVENFGQAVTVATEALSLFWWIAVPLLGSYVQFSLADLEDVGHNTIGCFFTDSMLHYVGMERTCSSYRRGQHKSRDVEMRDPSLVRSILKHWPRLCLLNSCARSHGNQHNDDRGDKAHGHSSGIWTCTLFRVTSAFHPLRTYVPRPLATHCGHCRFARGSWRGGELSGAAVRKIEQRARWMFWPALVLTLALLIMLITGASAGTLRWFLPLYLIVGMPIIVESFAGDFAQLRSSWRSLRGKSDEQP
jgi:hypothetical protein